ncbi:MAG TPA: hypothetical protein VGD98_03395 [Ktedonobacteraceae bacterium]
MPVPTFKRQFAGQLLWYLELANQPAGLKDYAVAFLPRGPKEPQAELNLVQSWSIGGIYIFLGRRVANEQQLITDVYTYMNGQQSGLVWIANPVEPPKLWQASKVVCNENWQVVQKAAVRFSNYFLNVDAGNQVVMAPGDESLVMPASQTLYWQCDPGGYRFGIEGQIELPFGGEAVGALKCSLLSAYQPPNGLADFEKLDASLYYFFQPVGGGQTLSVLRYQVMSGSMYRLFATLDPVNPLVKTRTILRFLRNPAALPEGTLETGFVTVYGSRITLVPVGSQTHPLGPGLIFTVRPSTTQPHADDHFYLAFDGSFTLKMVLAGDDIRLLCGFSGAEYLHFEALPDHVFTFFANQPAFAPTFRQQVPVAQGTPLLTDLATTSWLAFTPAKVRTLHYFAQPEGAALYTFISLLQGALQYQEVPAGIFPGTPASVAMSFPLVPYKLLPPVSLEAVRALELQILSPIRRNVLTQYLLPAGNAQPAPETTLTTTPQGLLLQLDKSLGYWQKLTLAQQQKGAQVLQVANVVGGMKAALQTNQLFAVITNKDEFLRCCQPQGNFSLTIDGWGFNFSPLHWPQYKSMMLIKYAGRSIKELALDTSAWSWLAASKGWNELLDSVEMTQIELLALIKEASEQEGNELADFYRRVLNNPDWNGVLFLRVPVSSFPQNIQNLLIGLVGSALYGHHIVIDSTPIQVINGTISTQDSALSGFVDYADAEDLYYDNLDYTYKVLALKVTLANSLVVNLTSQVELMINRLFADDAILENSVRSNNLVLNGYLQGEGADARFVFSEEGSHVFHLKNSVLSRVEVTQAQFLTLEPDEQNPNRVSTVFILGGNLEFAENTVFDIFSYGRVEQEGESGSKLQFANLLIYMDFTSDQPLNLDFRFEAGSMAFDLSKSTARPASLVQHFPLKLAGLIQGLKENGPGELGYIDVASPLTQSAMTYPWYGLAFELDLGTLGALAGAVGLTVTLLAAWLPDPGERRVYIGMRLPGLVSTRPELRLEGVLKLSFGSMLFTVKHDQGSAYMLRLRNMALSVLGFSLPPGQTDVFLFGDPTGSGSGTLGWYAAYAHNDEQTKVDAVYLRQRLLLLGESTDGH